MNCNFREQMGMPKLGPVLGVTKKSELTRKQQKALTNIKWCANDQWGYVNSWYDERSEEARKFMLDAASLFDTIYSESLANVYGEGFCIFNSSAQSYLKDVRFCGKKFLEIVTLYFTAKLLEEAVPEVEGTEEDAKRVADALMELKNRILK